MEEIDRSGSKQTPRSGIALVKRWRKVIVGLLAAVAIVVAATITVGLLAYTTWTGSRVNEAEAIETTLAWARLAPLPADAREIVVTAQGTSFTRSFRLGFVLPADVLDEWLRKSRGIADTQPTTPAPDRRHYPIEPGGGAQHAEVEVDDTSHRVSVYVYWS
jgi:hypothetical protein